MVLWTIDPLVAARRIYLSAGFRLLEEERHHSLGVDLIGQSYVLDPHPIQLSERCRGEGLPAPGPGARADLPGAGDEDRAGAVPRGARVPAMPEVLATGFLVGLLEWACIQLVNPHLDWPTEQTLGTHVDVSHDAATPPGLAVTVTARLTAVEGRRLSFAVEAHDGIDLISHGTQRAHRDQPGPVRRQGPSEARTVSVADPLLGRLASTGEHGLRARRRGPRRAGGGRGTRGSSGPPGRAGHPGGHVRRWAVSSGTCSTSVAPRCPAWPPNRSWTTPSPSNPSGASRPLRCSSPGGSKTSARPACRAGTTRDVAPRRRRSTST